MKKITDNKKMVVYIAGGIIAIAIIISAIIVFSMVDFGASNEQHIIADDTNPVLEIAEESTRQASTQVGKTVSEVKEENNSEDGQADEENTVDEEIKEILDEEDIEETNTEIEENSEEDEEVEEAENQSIKFIMPVEGEILRDYAKDKLVYSDTLKEWVTHAGVDIKAPKTTVVKAAEEGKIKSIKNDPRYGLTVVINHDDGFSTVYSNLLTAEFVSVGEYVDKGQTIATVGNTASFEIADEPHLHFEILKDNEQIDPNMYIK